MNIEERVTFEPDKCGGKPCIRGLRIRVIDVLGLLARDITTDQVLEELPSLEREDLLACLGYATNWLDIVGGFGMGAWLTTHYPHSPGHPWHIYLKENYKHSANFIKRGDFVFFFELKGKEGNGKGEIAAVSRVLGDIEANDYRMGSRDEGNEVWPWMIECYKPRFGDVDPGKLDAILGRNFSEHHRVSGGLLPLEEVQANRLLAAFVPKP